jgi:hypothetical protein
MQLLWTNLAVVTVVMIYLLWQTYLQVHRQRQRRLRQRVAYMLWVAAEEEACGEPAQVD